MAEVARVIRISKALYLGVPRKIAEMLCLRAGDRMAVITDGRTLAAAKIDMHEIVNRALLKEAVRVTSESASDAEENPHNSSGRASTVRAEHEG
jgi:hypothetical protein